MTFLQQNEINELKDELNELNKLKQQEAIELADIEYDIYQMETNFLSKSNPLRSLIIKGKSLSTNNSDSSMSNYNENDDRIISNSSLTSQAVINTKQSKKGLTTSQSHIIIKQEGSVAKSELVPVSMSLDCLKEEEEESPYELRKERRASKRKL